jgi:cystathionine beta-lyase/cystathionine gamma-synthase
LEQADVNLGAPAFHRLFNSEGGESMRKETQCVHSGKYEDETVRGTNTPIFTSSAYQYLDMERTLYPRYFNTPNQEAVVQKLCELETAENGLIFSSGMAAISTSILAFAGEGDHVLMLDELYGGTHAFATDTFSRFGIKCSFAPTDADETIRAATPQTRVLVIESPTNPLLGIIDIKKISEAARARGIVSIIDNTFATPINQNPLTLGIDVVVHSGTKYLGGHSDLCCGAALGSSKMIERVRSMARHLGGSLNAISCYLLERSLKTLAIRVERQSANAMNIAEFLSSHKSVRRVNYPGLAAFKGHEIARSQMRGFGGMLSFELDESAGRPSDFQKRLKLITPAVSLGGVETLICSPVLTSHSKISARERERIGINDSLLRLSVGIESADDLVEDLDRALQLTAL